MTDATTETSTLEDGGALELVRTPAWEAQYRLGQDPKELAHMFCCRDMDWSKAMCGYEDPNPAIMYEPAGSICTMCVWRPAAARTVPWRPATALSMTSRARTTRRWTG
jgi:hypothetical protein